MSDCAESLKLRGICVIIPTFNNAGTIQDVVQRAQIYCDDIFVVVDGSTDSTVTLLKDLTTQPRIISLPTNTGKGNALKEGFFAAINAGFSYAITLDADGQHYPEDIPLFLDANKKHPRALIVGNRKGLSNVKRSFGSRFANHFSNFWFFIQTQHPLKDTQTGYRLYPLKHIHGLSLITSRYEAELELLVLSSWFGTELKSIDVNVYYPPKEERVSHFQPIRDFTRISILNTFLCCFALVFGLPITILRWIGRIIITSLTFISYCLFVGVFFMPPMFLFIKLGEMSKHKKELIHKGIYTVNLWAKKLLPGIKFIQINKNGEQFDKPAIILCNHQSHLDLIQLLSLTPKLIVLTADYIQKNPLYGCIIKAADFLPVSQGYDSIEKKLKEFVQNGYSIAIYPEGTRSLDGRIGRFHQGAFYLADKFDIDVLPIILYGSGKALPKHKLILRRWPVYYEIDKRISIKQLKLMSSTYKEQASLMKKYYIARYSEVSDFCEKNII